MKNTILHVELIKKKREKIFFRGRDIYLIENTQGNIRIINFGFFTAHLLTD
jgi:hypothetical protein